MQLQQKHKFFPFFFRWPSGWAQLEFICMCAWECVAMTPQDITSATSVHYTTTTTTTTAKTKTSKLINSKTKVEHARKINIKKVAKASRVTPLFLFIMYERNISEIIVGSIFRCHCCLCSCSRHGARSLSIHNCFRFALVSWHSSGVVLIYWGLFVSQTKAVENKSR